MFYKREKTNSSLALSFKEFVFYYNKNIPVVRRKILFSTEVYF